MYNWDNQDVFSKVTNVVQILVSFTFQKTKYWVSELGNVSYPNPPDPVADDRNASISINNCFFI